MDFRGDERGQPVQIGFILLFGILVLAFASYQGYVVPDQNAKIEFNHFQTVDDQFTEFQSNLVNAEGSETERATTFSLGVQYPSRLIALNPPPVSGQLQTTEPGEVDISGDGSNPKVCGTGNVTSRSLVYSPGYNEFDNAEAMTYENGFVARTYSEGTVFGKQRLVRNTSGSPHPRIDLTLLTGSVSENGQGSYSQGVNATRGDTVEIRNPNITLPSQYEAHHWEEKIIGNVWDFDATNTDEGRVILKFEGLYKVSCAVASLNGHRPFEPYTEEQTRENSNGTFHTQWLEDDPLEVTPYENVVLDMIATSKNPTIPISGAAVDYSFAAQKENGGEFSFEGQSRGQTNASGKDSISPNLDDVAVGDRYNLYVVSGDDSDVIELKVNGSKFDYLTATSIDGRFGHWTWPDEVEFNYSLTEDVPNVEFTVNQSHTDTGPGISDGFHTEDVRLTGPSWDREYPLVVTAEIQGGECLQAIIQDEDDTQRLSDNDWSIC